MLIYENKMGKNQAMDGHAGCYPHIHHHIELVYVHEGVTDASIGSNSHFLKKDDIMIVFPNQIHVYNSDYQPLNKSYILIYSPDDYPEFKDIFNLKIPVNPIINNTDAEIKELFRLIIMYNNGNNPYKRKIERGYMLVLLSKLFNLLDFTDQNAVCLSTVQNVLLYCDNNYKSNISLEKLAAELYVSKFYISRIFNEKIKISFSDYINALRINDSMQQLKHTSISITEIAYNVGYQNIRSYNRQFLNQNGITPRGYRKAYQKSAEPDQ